MKRTVLLIIGLMTCLAISGTALAQELSPAVRGQIDSIQAEKAARTPAQRKLDSQLLYLTREAQGLRAVEGVPNLKSRVERKNDGRVVVDISAEPSAELAKAITDAGGAVLYESPRWKSVRASLPPAALIGLAARVDVKSIKREAKPNVHTGPVVNEADAAHKAGASRTNFAVNGSRIKVGVISDSAKNYLTSVAKGELPWFTVLPGRSGDLNTGGEGTAMSEIVADIAPGAQVYFATAVGGKAFFADSILLLRSNGCNVIVDDISYTTSEWQFQDDEIGQAINTVVSNGVVYLSSSGNEGNLKRGTSSTWEGDFVEGGTDVLFPSGRVHSFGAQNYNLLTNGPSDVVLQWSDEYHTSSNDYDLYILNAAGTAIVASSTDTQDGTQEPIEVISDVQPGNRIVIWKDKTAAPRYLRLIGSTSRLQVATRGQTIGHAGTASVICVASSDASEAVASSPFTFTVASLTEASSSDGPHKMFYRPDGTPFTPGNFLASGGVTLQTPALTAGDGGQTSVPGYNPFYGTSAAAPAAAGIAALVWSKYPSLNNVQVRSILERSCLDIEASGFDINSGNGLLMADLALVPRLPQITQQPQATNVIAGAPATFRVTATNTLEFSSLAYQWRRGSANLPGATNATLTLAKVLRDDSGQYSVRVSSAEGFVDSASAQLSVTLPSQAPVILAQPRNQSVAQGANVVLSITAQGSDSLSYQWRKNGSALPTALAATLEFNNIAPASAGPYQVVVSNPFGAVTSIVAVLNISSTLVAPAISDAPRAETASVGGTATFSVTATGSQPLTYQWRKNGQVVANATASVLTVTGVTATDAGDYTVVVGNAVNSVTSPAATLSVRAPLAGQNTWTILVYGHGDHSLSLSLVDDMIEMERVGSKAGFNIVVQADFNSKANHYGELPAGLEKGVSRFLLQQSPNSDSLFSTPVQRLPELNQDDPVNLTDFVRWGIQNYPSDRIALILWDHGGQWEGFGGDQQDGTLDFGAGILTAQINIAVKKALEGTAVKKFDFFAFDTCLMGGTEVLGDFTELSDVFVACPEIDYGPGWDYTATFDFLQRNPGVSAHDFAATEVEKWAAHHFTGSNSSEFDRISGAHAAYDLTAYPAFKDAFFAFSPLLREFISANTLRYAQIRRQTTPYSVGGAAALKQATKFTDLGEVAQKLADEPLATPALKDAARTLVSRINKMIINTARGTGKRNALGLSVYLPTDGDFSKAYKDLNLFASDKSWIELLDVVYFARLADQTAPVVTDPQPGVARSASRNAPASLAFHVEDTEDLNHVNGYLVSRSWTGDPNELVYLGHLFTTSEIAPLDGEFVWNGTAPMIWGADSAKGLYLGGFLDASDPSIMTSYAEYLPPDSDQSQFVILQTDVSGENPRIVAVLDGESKELAPIGIDLRPDGLLTPVYYTEYQIEGDPDTFESYSILADDSLLIPADGLAGIEVAMAYLAPADYTISVQSQDDFGNLSQAVEFTVTIEPEALTMSTTVFTDGFMEVSWYDPYGDIALQTTADLGNPVWDEIITNDYIDSDGDQRSFIFFPEDIGEHRFFRLFRP